MVDQDQGPLHLSPLCNLLQCFKAENRRRSLQLSQTRFKPPIQRATCFGSAMSPRPLIWLAVGCLEVRLTGRVVAPVGAGINYSAIFVSAVRWHICCWVYCVRASEIARSRSAGTWRFTLEEAQIVVCAHKSSAIASMSHEWRRQGRGEKEGMIELSAVALVYDVSLNLWCEWFDSAPA